LFSRAVSNYVRKKLLCVSGKKESMGVDQKLNKSIFLPSQVGFFFSATTLVKSLLYQFMIDFMIDFFKSLSNITRSRDTTKNISHLSHF
jgi:hypothetical protein